MMSFIKKLSTFLFLLMMYSVAYSQQPDGYYHADMKMDGETIKLTSHLSQKETENLKLKTSIQKLRKSFLNFLNVSEKKYNFPNVSEVNIILFKDQADYQNFIRSNYSSDNLLMGRRGFFDPKTNRVLAHQIKIEDERDRPIQYIALHEYTHYLLRVIFGDNLNVAKKSASTVYSYDWLNEGLPNYLTNKVLYNTPISDADFGDIIAYTQHTHKDTHLNQIIRMRQDNPVFYMYSAAVVAYCVSLNKHKEIVLALENLFSPEGDYPKIMKNIFEPTEDSSEIEINFQIFLADTYESNNKKSGKH